jgi:alpha-tubulin suppressor-like RCC1 family protein
MNKHLLTLAAGICALAIAFVSCGGSDTIKAVAPKIVIHPENTDGDYGRTATFSARANGNPAPTYQWQVSTDGTNWADISGATKPNFTTETLTDSDDGKKFRMAATNSAGSETSSGATLTVNLIAPAITAQPANRTVVQGSQAQFIAASSGAPAPTLQWEVSTNNGTSWSNVAGATSATYTITAATLTQSGNLYRMKATNDAGNATSRNARLQVNVDANAPMFTAHPADRVATAGQTVAFAAAASGTPTPSYQWQVSTNDGATWTNVLGATGASYTAGPLAASSNGHLYQVVATNGSGSDTSNAATLRVHKQITAAGGTHFVLALKTDGLWTWGRNNSGQLGDGTTDNSLVPIQISSQTDWVSLAGGDRHALALKANGTLWAWGRNAYGMLGDGTNTDRLAPVQVGIADDWALVSGGDYHSLALKKDGSLWAWGDNEYGQVGDGTVIERQSPVRVGTENNWVAISAGSEFSIALKATGTIWAWGDNSDGQLGDGTTAGRLVPGQVGSQTDWVAATAGLYHAIGLKANGTLWAWGLNENGQLGDGTQVDRYTAVQVGTDANWAAVTCGGGHTIALKTNGTVWGWGDNYRGQLGIGSDDEERLSPAQVGSDTTWAAISTGYRHSIGLRNNGSLWTWGNNEYGNLGIGSTVHQRSPMQVGTGYRVP